MRNETVKYYCDRCNKEIHGNGSVPKFRLYKHGVFIGRFNPIWEVCESLDLCPERQDSLNKWFREENHD